MNDEGAGDLAAKREALASHIEVLLSRVRQEGDSDARARSRLQATERQALDRMRDELAEMDTRLRGGEPGPPMAR